MKSRSPSGCARPARIAGSSDSARANFGDPFRRVSIPIAPLQSAVVIQLEMIVGVDETRHHERAVQIDDASRRGAADRRRRESATRTAPVGEALAGTTRALTSHTGVAQITFP